jgi:hypothetical protein
MMAEVEIPMQSDNFEEFRRARLTRPIDPRLSPGGTIRLVEVDRGLRTGRWAAYEVGKPAWPPMAACYARNPAAARIEVAEATS